MLRALPSVDQVLRDASARDSLERHGRSAMTQAVRAALENARQQVRDGAPPPPCEAIVSRANEALDGERTTLRSVFNLTGTVLHTNFGRALLADVAIEAATAAMRDAVALEYDLETGRRGERDDHLREIVCELTGAEDATVVNNNAAAVLLALNTFGAGREGIVSRGELIEIGGAFRMPDIMSRAGVTLVEVGTTNRTHARDYRNAITSATGLILKVHTSNYRIAGFTAEVEAPALAQIAQDAKVPLLNDLGSGTLVDLSRYGLSKEPTVREAIAEGADLVTFSGDKLLGGPQAGFIVGRKDLITRINANPMKRALRVDKMRIAALAATLDLYRDPDRLAEKLPTLRFLARKAPDICEQAARLRVPVAEALGPTIVVDVCACTSQIGSGALPLETLPSAGLRLSRADSRSPDGLSETFRQLPKPIVGRIRDNALILDLRCLEDETGFIASLAASPKHAVV